MKMGVFSESYLLNSEKESFNHILIHYGKLGVSDRCQYMFWYLIGAP